MTGVNSPFEMNEEDEPYQMMSFQVNRKSSDALHSQTTQCSNRITRRCAQTFAIGHTLVAFGGA
jgi:hypothetical protein